MAKKSPNYKVVFFFFFLSFMHMGILWGMAENTTIPVKIGVVLESDTGFGKMGLSCINMALSDFYKSHGSYRTRLVLYPRDSNGDVVGAASAALDLIKNVEVQAIIGPESSMQANFLTNLGDKAQLPIISFSATSPSLSSIHRSYFFQATQSDAYQVKSISAIIEAFGWRETVLIYVDNEYGDGVIPFLTDALQKANIRVPYRSAISQTATDDQIVEELYKLMTMQTRVFVVHMLTDLGSRIFTKAKEIGMMSEDYVWIISNSITNILGEINDGSVLDSMHGVLGVKTYIPKTEELKDFRFRWRRKFHQDNPNVSEYELNVYGLWAYDATVALAMAVEKIGANNFGFYKPNVSSNSIDLENFGIAQNGQRLCEALSNTKFGGLSGEFSVVDGRLNSSTFQIINLIGNGERVIAFWTPQNGYRKNLESTNTGTYSISKENIHPIIWPGDSTSVPRGWVIPTNGKKLRIGIPVKYGVSNFVRILNNDPTTNITKATGYSIDVFEALMEVLPYAVPYVYIPFANASGKSAGSYDDLVNQVHVGNFDAAVGDITIRANRSRYVDFTLPYTESGVSMVVQIRDRRSKNAWIFLKPLKWDLWVTSACCFVFIGFVIWFLEHQINEDFRGPPAHQVGTSFWFSFSTAVFGQRERVYSNLARIVVLIWLFVVFILTQSYTASLTTHLTVQQLEPTITDVNELLRKKLNVGYPKGSFVFELLKAKGFEDSRLIVYDSLAKCNEMFSNGIIVAAFDEIPYMKLFTASYCFKYAMVGPALKANGFGFVFPKNSPLVHDISRAVLIITEGDRMKQIENTWLKRNVTCQDPSTLFSSALDLECFRGLFLVAGIASSSALVIFLATFVYGHWHVLNQTSDSIWRRFWILLRILDEKDLGSHTSRKSEPRDGNDIGRKMQVESLSVKDYPSTPSSYSSHRDPKFSFFTGQGTASTTFDDRMDTGQPSP